MLKKRRMSGKGKGESGEGWEQGKRRGEGTGAEEEGQRAAKRQDRTSISSEGMEGGEEELPGGCSLCCGALLMWSDERHVVRRTSAQGLSWGGGASGSCGGLWRGALLRTPMEGQ